MEQLFFPIFINLSGKKILVVGGGRIASRRIKTLSEFGAELTVIAPGISHVLARMEAAGRIQIQRSSYETGMAEGYDLVFSAINDSHTDQSLYRECKEKGIPINIASDKELCDFYFPGIVKRDDIIVGVSSGGQNYKKVRQITAFIRSFLNEISGRVKEDENN